MALLLSLIHILQIWDDVDGENQAWKFTEVKAAKKPAAKKAAAKRAAAEKDGPAKAEKTPAKRGRKPADKE